MATSSMSLNPPRPDSGVEPIELENGDRLDQQTFHTRYLRTPDSFKAELIGGIVHMPSPLRLCHGLPHANVMLWLGTYCVGTKGVLCADNTTSILGEDSEPQPDAMLIVLPTFGGQTRENDDGYLVGPPELIVEVASSSAAIDLHAKKADYEKAGVGEYVVLAIRPGALFWWKLHDGKYVELPAGDDGIFRSEKFPGLWLDAAALIRGDAKGVLDVLQHGLASPAHDAFVTELARVAAGK